MKYILSGRGGMLTSIVLDEVVKAGFIPHHVIIEQENNTAYPNLTEIICKQKGIPYRIFNDINSEESRQLILDLNPDFVVVASLKSILRKPLLDICTFYNVHMGILPDYRGAFTNFWKIKNGDDLYGATIHIMDEKIDNGAIIKKGERDFSLITDGFQFFRLNYLFAAELLIDVLQKISDNNYKPLTPETSDNNGKYYRKFNDADFEIVLTDSCEHNFKFINRIQFYASPFFKFNEEKYFVSHANLLLIKEPTELKSEIQFDFINDSTVLLHNDSGILEMKIIK
jgi:methionyl-tRNA formyltransferase